MYIVYEHGQTSSGIDYCAQVSNPVPLDTAREMCEAMSLQWPSCWYDFLELEEEV